MIRNVWCCTLRSLCGQKLAFRCQMSTFMGRSVPGTLLQLSKWLREQSGSTPLGKDNLQGRVFFYSGLSLVWAGHKVSSSLSPDIWMGIWRVVWGSSGTSPPSISDEDHTLSPVPLCSSPKTVRNGVNTTEAQKADVAVWSGILNPQWNQIKMLIWLWPICPCT